MSRLLRAPALHFLVLGGLLFALAGPRREVAAERRIVLGPADVAELRDAWTRAHGRPPSEADDRALLARAVDDEVLHREALALGLDRRDPLVRARRAGIARFLDEPVADAGLEQRDLVSRRHLEQLVWLGAGKLTAADLPDEDALAAYLAAHADDFAEPARVRAVHVYLGRDRHGATLARDAAAAVAALRAGAAPTSLGDPFIAGAAIGPATLAEVERRLGPALRRAVAEAPLGAWVGPVASPYGLHLVRVEAREPASVPPLDAVRGQVVQRVLAERSAARRTERLAALRARYDVRVEGR